MPSRHLIVTADDFGLSPGINAGVVLAHRQGILTSASLLATAPFAGAAASLARENPGLDIGVHLNLVRGKPVLPPASLPNLVDRDGAFRLFRWRHLSPAFLGEAEREYRAQIEKSLSLGLVPSHLDFEKHHAWQAGLYRLASDLAREYGIGGIRNLAEPLGWSLRHGNWPGWRRLVMSLALRSGVLLARHSTAPGLLRPEHFLGQLHIGQLNQEAWLKIIPHLPPGISEVMTHPGQREKDSNPPSLGWLGKHREVELSALLSPAVKRAIESNFVRLVGYQDLMPSRLEQVDSSQTGKPVFLDR